MNKFLVIDINIHYLLRGMNHTVGGASVQTFNWIYGMKKCGYQAIIISPKAFKCKEALVEKISIPENNFTKHHKQIVFYFKVLKKHSPDFIYISVPDWSNIIPLIIAKLLKVKVIQRISNDYLVDSRAIRRFGLIKYWVYQKQLSLATLILCQNNYQFESIKTKYTKIQVKKMYNPFKFEGVDCKNTNRVYVAWIGIFQYQKNLKELFNITKQLPEVQFKIAGRGYESIDEETKRVVQNLKDLPNVKFIGLLPREQIINFLTESFCLLNTSHYEGFPNTYLEAFSTCTPVVTRKLTDPDGIIQKYSLGKAVNDYDKLPNAILEIRNSKKEKKTKYGNYLKLNHNPVDLAKKIIKILS